MRIWEQERTHSGVDDYSIYYPIVGRTLSGYQAFDKALSKSNLVEPTLFSVPGTHKKLVPSILLADEFGRRAYRKMAGDRRKVFFIVLAYLLGTPVLLYWLPTPLVGFVMLLLVSLLSYLAYEYRTLFQDIKSLQDRARFYTWVACQCRPYLVVTLAMFFSAGFFQVLYSSDPLTEFGFHYELYGSGERWRLLTGLFLHTGLPHWLGNLMMGTVVVVSSGPILRQLTIPVFLVAGSASFFLTDLYEGLRGTDLIGLVGASGGLCGLLGCVLVLIYRFRSSYPKGYSITIGMFLVFGMGFASLLLKNTSTACHFFGALSGMAIALFLGDNMEIPSLDNGR